MWSQGGMKKSSSMMHSNRFLAAVPAVFMLVAGWSAGDAHALALGNLSVESNLGEPLRLVINVNSVSQSEAETLDVSLASRSDYARAGVEYPLRAGLLNFELLSNAGGDYQVIITTDDAVDDTYLHFLISAIWSGGKAVREYHCPAGPASLPAARRDPP